MHYGEAAASLITWSRTLRLLFISKSKIGSERATFWVNRRHQEVCNAGLKRCSRSCFPEMLQGMAAPLERVCAGTRDALWMWPHCSLWINEIKLFFGNSLIILLSDHVLLFQWLHRPSVFSFVLTFFSTLSHKRTSFGGLGVACWTLVPKFAGSNLAEAVRFLRAKKKFLSTPSFGGKVKPSVPCRRFAACKRSLNVAWKSSFRQNYRTTFSPTVPPSAAGDLSRRGGREGTWWWKVGTSKKRGKAMASYP